jgi:hypothetical protein
MLQPLPDYYIVDSTSEEDPSPYGSHTEMENHFCGSRDVSGRSDSGAPAANKIATKRLTSAIVSGKRLGQGRIESLGATQPAALTLSRLLKPLQETTESPIMR